jgi:hypothetical protein
VLARSPRISLKSIYHEGSCHFIHSLTPNTKGERRLRRTDRSGSEGRPGSSVRLHPHCWAAPCPKKPSGWHASLRCRSLARYLLWHLDPVVSEVTTAAAAGGQRVAPRSMALGRSRRGEMAYSSGGRGTSHRSRSKDDGQSAAAARLTTGPDFGARRRGESSAARSEPPAGEMTDAPKHWASTKPCAERLLPNLRPKQTLRSCGPTPRMSGA